MFRKSSFFSLLGQTWSFADKDRPQMVLFYGMSLVANLVRATQPLIMAQLLDALGRGGPDVMQALLGWTSLFALAILIFWSLHGPARVIEGRFAFKLYRRYVNHLYRMVVEMPLKWQQDHHSGDTLDRVAKSSRALFAFARDQFIFIEIFVRYFGSLLFLALLCWWLAFIAFSLSLVVLALVKRRDALLRTFVHETNEKEHFLSAALYDYVGNILSILTLQLGPRTQKEIDRRFLAMRKSYNGALIYNEKKWFTLNMGIVVVKAGLLGVYIAVQFSLRKPLEAGTLVAIFQYLSLIEESFGQGAKYADNMLRMETDVRAVKGLLEDHAALAIASGGKAVKVFQSLIIEDLTYAHQVEEPASSCLKKINCTIRAGEKLALIGRSGAGKTTFLTLLRGLYDAQRVNLVMDGVRYETLAPLASLTTLVSQDAEIFENTIRYNITMGLSVAERDIWKWLEAVCLDDFVRALPDGLETHVRERGVSLSGGQKQRLALARGLLAGARSPLILLDEPTSHVDLATEEKIFDHILKLCADQTLIVSVHRLHLLPRFDRAFVVKAGHLTEQSVSDFGHEQKGPKGG